MPMDAGTHKKCHHGVTDFAGARQSAPPVFQGLPLQILPLVKTTGRKRRPHRAFLRAAL